MTSPTLVDLLESLAALGIRLWREGDKLKFDAPKGALTPDLRRQLKARKPELLDHLSRQGLIPLASAQARLWFLDRLAGGNLNAYNMPIALRLEGELDRNALANSFSRLMQRHDILRTTFPAKDGAPYQHIHPYAVDQVNEIQLDHLDPETRHAACQQILKEHSAVPFDLSRPPLIRRSLIRLEAQVHVLLVVVHHILVDGWSMGLLIDELARLYNGEILPEPDRQFADVVVNDLNQSDWQLDFWRETLKARPAALALPVKRSRPESPGFRGDSVHFSIENSRAVNILARDRNITTFTLLQTALAILLGRLAGSTDVIIGTPVANRHHTQHETIIGLFINTVVLRNDLSHNPTVNELLERTSRCITAAFDHGDTPYERVVQAAGRDVDGHDSPLFQVLFVLQNAPYAPTFTQGLRAEMIRVETSGSKFDLTLSITETSKGMDAHLEYDSDLFDATFARQLGVMLNLLLDQMCGGPEDNINTLTLVSHEDRRNLLAHMTSPPNIPKESLFQQFLNQARRTPHQAAVCFGPRVMSYADLADLALRHAAALEDAGMGRESLVAICRPKSITALAVILAVQARGAAYLPLDPNLPTDRLLSMCQQAQPHLLHAPPDSFPQYAGTRLHQPADRLGGIVPSLPQSAAYVMFTSGSTGKPKGVVVTRAVVRNLIACVDCGDSSAVTLQAAPLGFDVSFQEIFSTLCGGGCLVILDDDSRRNPFAVLETIRTRAVRRLFMPFTALQQLAQACDSEPPELDTIITAGEAVHLTPGIRGLMGPQTRLLNQYGPTETHVITQHKVPSNSSQDLPPIGLAIPGCSALVLDANLEPVPIGATGRLYLGGMGLGRGYVNNPAATAAAFIPNPHGTHGTRLYDSGDLARMQDGVLHFMGREDNQIKLRGYRIEIGEIEIALERHGAVSEAVVRLDTHASPHRLVAFIRLNNGQTAPAVSDLRKALARDLPPYMIPAHFQVLSSFPTTASGKVNRRALEIKTQPAAPPAIETNPTAAISRIWCDLLGLETVDENTNFFDVGGHSLLVVPMITQINQVLEAELEVVDLFRHPNIAALAAKINGAAGSEIAATPPHHKQDRIAVIGMACRLPQADNIHQFWDNLIAGRECTTTFSADELRDAGVPGHLINHPDYVRVGTRLTDYDRFDAAFFGISPREAATMDPQHRLFLEEAWHALEDAGYADTEPHVGVFAGVDANRYLTRNLLSDPDVAESLDGVAALIGNDKDYVTTRVSYKLNLTGPSLNIQTACSTSLTAVHLACESLRRGECKLALAGGASLQVPEESGYLYRQGGILSRDGRCRPFDAAANGTIAGSGVGAVVLKLLSQAQIDGDHVYAIIPGSAINNDGGDKVGYTAPGLSGQSRVIRAALAQAGLSAHQMGYVEAHGTGTKLGDPAEAAALQQAYGNLPAGTEITLGSVKANVGHLGSAAGITGLIKTCLACHHNTLPGTVHFKNPNPTINFAPFRVIAHNQSVPRVAGQPFRAGVSSFGIGGSNAHVIVEQAPQTQASQRNRYELLVLSARTEAALLQSRDQLCQLNPALADTAYTLAVGRKAMDRRLYGVAGENESLGQALRHVKPAPQRPKPTGLVFLLPGQGGVAQPMKLSSQFTVMGEQLAACAAILKPLGHDLYAALNCASPADDMLQIIQFAISYALARQWMAWGLRPKALLGHSLGQYTAACLAGVFNLADGLRLVAARNRIMVQMPMGGMLALSLSESEAADLLSPGIELAAVNGRDRVVLSGDRSALEALAAKLPQAAPTFLNTSHAFHSNSMGPAAAQLEAVLKEIRLNPPTIPIIANHNGLELTAEAAVDPQTWINHMLEPVRFAAGLKTARRYGDLFLETGRGQVLSRLAARQDPSVLALASLPDNVDDDQAALLEALGRLWSAGVAVDWPAFHAGQDRRRISLPGYPFQRRKHWITPKQLASVPDTAHILREELDTIMAEMTAVGEPAGPGLAMEDLCLAFTVDILARMGCELQERGRFTTPELAAGLGVTAERERQLDTLLAILRQAEILTKDAGPWAESNWRVQREPKVRDPQAEALALQHRYPSIQPACKMLTDIAAAMPDILRGHTDTAKILFPDGKADQMADLYRDLPLQQEMNGLMAMAVRRAVAGAEPANPALILEIGAGTGATTVGILPRLPADRVRYTFTDISAFFTVKAQTTLADYDFMDFKVFNAEQPPAEQGLQPSSYRVVTASNVIHATRDLRESLGHAYSLLEPGGMLILLEGTGRSNFADLVFGGLSGWNRFTDFDVRTSLCPSLDTWLQLLSDIGFDQVASAPERETETNRGTAILLARKPLDAAETDPHQAMEQHADTSYEAPQTPTETVICQITAELFGIHRISRNTDFFDIGGDSLIAIQMNQRIEQELKLSIDAADLAAFPTPAQLAAHLDQEKARGTDQN